MRNSKLLTVLAVLACGNCPAGAQEAPPPMQEGYVCNVYLHDIGLPDKAVVFVMTREPDCQGEWIWEHNYICPPAGSAQTNIYACSKATYSPHELQMLHEELMVASQKKLRTFAVRGPCLSGQRNDTCFVELGYMNLPAPAKAMRKKSAAGSPRSSAITTTR